MIEFWKKKNRLNKNKSKIMYGNFVLLFKYNNKTFSF